MLQKAFLLIIFATTTVFAESPEDLFLQQKRLAAALKLRQLLSGAETPAQVESIQKQLKQVTESHYTNRALRLFVEVESMALKHPLEAQKKMDELEKMEPDNLKVKRLKVLMLLRNDKCRDAEEDVEKIGEILPNSPSHVSLKILMAACRKAPYGGDISNVQDEWVILANAAHAAKLGDLERLKGVLQPLSQSFKEYAEIEFYKALLDEDNSELENLRQTYKMRCQADELPKKYLNNPWYCLNLGNMVPRQPASVGA